jgi:hypothetical protein
LASGILVSKAATFMPLREGLGIFSINVCTGLVFLKPWVGEPTTKGSIDYNTHQKHARSTRDPQKRENQKNEPEEMENKKIGKWVL